MVVVFEAVVVFLVVVVVLGLVVVLVFGVASATVVFAAVSGFDSGFASFTMATALRTSSLGSGGFVSGLISGLGAGLSTAGVFSSTGLEAAMMTDFVSTGAAGTRPGAGP